MVAHGPLAANPILWAKATLRRYRLPDQLRARILFGIAPGGACHAGPVASPPVGSYSTVSPLPMRTWAVSFLWRFPSGCPARALPGTIALWSPDFPRGNPRGHPATRACSAPTWMGGLGQLKFIGKRCGNRAINRVQWPCAHGAKMQAKRPQPRF
jgi:hypothetical protein